jgi:lysophospholipase L1-like esterase
MRWEQEIAAFEKADKLLMPAQDGVLFLGSSSIRLWNNAAKDFPDLHVINRGFGGSTIADSTYFAPRIVFPYQPRTIVFYAGDNDIAEGKTAGEVARDFRVFAVTVRRFLPQTRIIFIAIKPSPAREKFKPTQEEANKRIREWGETFGNFAYADIWTPMLTPTGAYRPELYQADKLHMTPAGYKIWREVLYPLLHGGRTGE